MIEIPLTKGYTAIVDDEDADLAQLKWQAHVDLRNGYVSAERTAYKAGVIRQRMSRIVMERILGCAFSNKKYVDHINRNTLDNRRENLRLATPTQNQQNACVKKSSASGLKGVRKKGNRWEAYIRIDKQLVYLGCFKTPEEASGAYQRSAKEHFGEYARFE